MSNKFNSTPLHVIVHINVLLSYGDGTMACEAGQYPHPNALVGQVSNETASHGVAAGTCYTCIPEQPKEVLSEYIGGESFAAGSCKKGLVKFKWSAEFHKVRQFGSQLLW